MREATIEPRVKEHENDDPSTLLKKARKGVTGWVQHRLLKVPRLKEAILSSSEPPCCGPSHPAPQVRGPVNDQSSPKFTADRLFFPVSHIIINSDPSWAASRTSRTGSNPSRTESNHPEQGRMISPFFHWIFLDFRLSLKQISDCAMTGI
jgi:hypothetical protein